MKRAKLYARSVAAGLLLGFMPGTCVPGDGFLGNFGNLSGPGFSPALEAAANLGKRAALFAETGEEEDPQPQNPPAEPEGST